MGGKIYLVEDIYANSVDQLCITLEYICTFEINYFKSQRKELESFQTIEKSINLENTKTNNNK